MSTRKTNTLEKIGRKRAKTLSLDPNLIEKIKKDKQKHEIYRILTVSQITEIALEDFHKAKLSNI